MDLLELPDLRHTLVDIGTTLLCISGYNGLPGRTLPVNLIHETARRSERVDNAALSNAASCEISGQMMERALFCTFSRQQARDLRKSVKTGEAYSSIERISAQKILAISADGTLQFLSCLSA